MAGFRDKFIYSVNKGVGIIPTRLLQKVSDQRLILPFYHAISDDEMPHIQHLYTIKGIKNFINDLDFLVKYYTPIDYKQFQEISHASKKAEKPSFLLSFDDGLKEFHDIIAPILLQKGIPAICFLNSAFIDNKDLFFRYKSSLLIDKIRKEPGLTSKIQSFFDGSPKIVQKILSIRYQNKDLLNELAKLIDYSFDDFLINHAPYLNSKQITSLINQGFHFGSHSIDHPEYQDLDLQEQIRQTRESMQFICNKFSIEYKAFAFPFTDYNVSKGFFNNVNTNNIVENTFGCAGQRRDVISNNYQRIPFEMTNLTGKQILNSELVYYLLKMPFGKNLIYRND
jgi:peptidoglycan/xylan/chitin deacetylase (PgdA/CDA1 family)